MRKYHLKTRFILASQSQRRHMILRDAGYSFFVKPAYDVEEEHTAKRPSTVVMHNARLKARALAALNPTCIIVGADTIVYGGGKVLGKPRSMQHAVRMLRSLVGVRHAVYTGVTICCAEKNCEHTFYERTTVTLKRLTTADITAYFSRVDPLDKAGAYAIQEHGEMIVRSVNGSVYTVAGFPIERFHHEYKTFLKELR